MLAVNRMGGRIRPQVPVVKSLASAICIGVGRIGRARGPDRADRLGARLGGRPAAARARIAAAAARRLRRRGRDLGDVQRPDRGRVLRARADPARTSRLSRSAWSCSARSPPTRSAGRRSGTTRSCHCRRSISPRRSSLSSTRAGRARDRGRASRSYASSTGGRTSPTACGAGRTGCVPRRAGSCSGVLLLARAADVRRRLSGAAARRRRALRDLSSCSGCWPRKILATSLTMWIGGSGGVFAPSLFMGAMLGSAYGAVRPPADAAARRGRPARMAWSGWAPCSPPRRARRSPR